MSDTDCNIDHLTLKVEATKAGYEQGVKDCESKLAEALAAIKQSNNALMYMKRERDAVLEELSQYLHREANRGLLSMGYHPPQAHLDQAMVRKIGNKPCPRCKAGMRTWRDLTPEEKKKNMGNVFSSIMQARAKVAINMPKDPPPPLNPTTHEIAGTAKPTEPPKCSHDPMYTTGGLICERCGENVEGS